MPGWSSGVTTTGSQDLIERFRTRGGSPRTRCPTSMSDRRTGSLRNGANALQRGVDGERHNPECALERQFDSTMGRFSFTANGMPKEDEMQTSVIQWWDEQQMVVNPPDGGRVRHDAQVPRAAVERTIGHRAPARRGYRYVILIKTLSCSRPRLRGMSTLMYHDIDPHYTRHEYPEP